LPESGVKLYASGCQDSWPNSGSSARSALICSVSTHKIRRFGLHLIMHSVPVEGSLRRSARRPLRCPFRLLSFFGCFASFLKLVVQGLITEGPTVFSILLWNAGLIISVLAFMVLAATVLYSVLCSLAGLVPERIPRLSKEVAGFLALHRSSSNSEAN